MAGEEAFLAALLGGSTGSTGRGYFDIDQFQKTIAGNDVWKQIAAPVFGAQFDRSTWSPQESLGVSAGQAFLGSLLKGVGQRSEANQMGKLAEVLPELYDNPLGVAVPDGLDPEAFRGIQLSAIREKKLKSDKTEESKERFFADVFSKNPEIAINALPDVAKKFGLDSRLEPQPEVPPAPAGKTLAQGRSTVEKYEDYFRQFNKTQPAPQASVAARELLSGEIAANKKSFDEAGEARDYGQKLLDMANTAKAGLSEAEETGGYENVKSAYDFIASNFPFNSEEAAKRRTGRQELASIGPSIVKMERSPGAVSNLETKLYLGAGPNVNQTTEANAVLAAKMQNLGKLNLDYADFLDAFREANQGSTAGAQRVWSQYRQAYPIFKELPGGSLELNENRPDWQEFFLGTPSASPGVESAAPVKRAPEPPPPGFELTGRVNANGDYGIRKIR